MGGNKDFTSEYEPRSTPLAPGQSTRQCVASHRRGGAFHHLKNALAKNRKDWPFGFLMVHAAQLDRLYRVTQGFLERASKKHSR